MNGLKFQNSTSHYRKTTIPATLFKKHFSTENLLLRVIILSLIPFLSAAQQAPFTIDSFTCREDIRVTVDQPAAMKPGKKTILVFYALPNGNTTAQTMGKSMQPGVDWHYDIQHIRAQTAFVRLKMKNRNLVVVYLENTYKSWPAWKQRHPAYRTEIPSLVDSLTAAITRSSKTDIYLNGHSGGGSFIFGYLAGVSHIPPQVKRISFLDSDYGYDSSYFPKLKDWLLADKKAALNVFAYNDSVALYNGKPVVSATGGTWYRSRLMLQHLQPFFSFTESRTDSILEYKSADRRVQFFFKPNYDRGIYHTQQVELNGFIHSLLCGTRWESKGYRYYGPRGYADLVR